MTRRPQSGFTLIELVIIVVVIGILSTAVVLSYDPVTLTVPAQADGFARHVQQTQLLAMSSGQQLRLTADGSDTYTVICATASANWPCNGGGAVTNPYTGVPFSITTQNGITVSAATVDFGPIGRPVTGAGAVSGVDTTFTLAGGTQTSTVTVQAITGFPVIAY